eukprot:s1200_g34.t1
MGFRWSLGAFEYGPRTPLCQWQILRGAPKIGEKSVGLANTGIHKISILRFANLSGVAISLLCTRTYIRRSADVS